MSNSSVQPQRILWKYQKLPVTLSKNEEMEKAILVSFVVMTLVACASARPLIDLVTDILLDIGL